jgi:NAD dependent epimerase/dehydratase family enzyme
MLPAFWLGLGGRVGAPDQYFPWITLDDVIGGFYHALWTEDLDGPVNLTAPTPVTMEAYTQTLADVLRRPAFLNVPSSIVRTVGGEMAEEMLLASARAVPERLRETGYEFGSSVLENGLRHVLGRNDT